MRDDVSSQSGMTQMIDFILRLLRPRQPRVSRDVIRDVLARNTATHNDRREWMGF
jgi:hypothetical protein